MASRLNQTMRGERGGTKETEKGARDPRERESERAHG